MTVTMTPKNVIGADPLVWDVHSRAASTSGDAIERVATLDSVVDEVARESMALLTHLRRLVDRVDSRCADSDAPTGPPPQPGPPPGARLGPYRIVEFLRAGGMGEIHRAVDERLDRTVALKILPSRHRADAHARRWLRDEARRLSSIRHPGVCTLHDLGHQDGVDFLVMEYVEGESVAERLAQGAIPPAEAIEIARQVASALDAVHRAGVVHADLKPGNVMLARRTESSEPAVKLLDFGLARRIGAPESDGDVASATCATRTDPHQVIGTWPYMAPEQFGDAAIDARTDIWGLGVLLYEMVCGRRPFPQRSAAALAVAILKARPEPPANVVASCGRELGAVIERCLEKDPARRWESCGELMKQLDDCAGFVLPAGVDGEIDVTPPPRGGRTVHRPALSARGIRRRNRSFLRQVGAVAVVCGALVSATAPSRAGESTQLDRAQMEDFLLHGQISEMQTLRVGVSGSSRAHVTWGDQSHDAHVQTVDTHIGSAPVPNTSDSYRYNVAAYRLDRMLDLDMVPVSVRVHVGGVPAALTWWVDDVEMMELDRRNQHVRPPDLHAWNVQMHRSNIFQELVSNSDFNQTNVLITKEWRIWLVDFTRAFRSYPRLRKPELLTRLEPRLREALERLDQTALRREMEDLLSKSQIRGILARRDLILEHFDAQNARPAAGATKVADAAALQEADATP